MAKNIFKRKIAMKYLSTYLIIIALCSLLGVEGNAMLAKRKADEQMSPRTPKKRKLDDQEKIKELLKKAYSVFEQLQAKEQSPGEKICALRDCWKFVQEREKEGYLTEDFAYKFAFVQNKIIKAVLGENDPFKEYRSYFVYGEYGMLNLPETPQEWEKYIEEFEEGDFKYFVNLMGLEFGGLNNDDFNQLVLQSFQDNKIDFLEGLLIYVTLHLCEKCMGELLETECAWNVFLNDSSVVERMLNFLPKITIQMFARIGIFQSYILECDSPVDVGKISKKAYEEEMIENVLNIPGEDEEGPILTPFQVAVVAGNSFWVKEFMQYGGNPKLKILRGPYEGKNCFECSSPEIRKLIEDEMAEREKFRSEIATKIYKTEFEDFNVPNELCRLIADFVPPWNRPENY